MIGLIGSEPLAWLCAEVLAWEVLVQDDCLHFPWPLASDPLLWLLAVPYLFEQIINF